MTQFNCPSWGKYKKKPSYRTRNSTLYYAKKKKFLVRGLCIRRGFYEKNGIRKRLQDRRPDMEENTQGWDYAFLAKSAFGYSE